MAETWHNLFSNALLFVALPCVCFFFTLYTIVALFQLLRASFYRLLRIGGVSAVVFFVFWGFAMTNSGAYPTREDKERSRCAQAEADAELSLMGGLLVSGAAQPPLLDLSSALTVPAWKYGVYEDGVRVDFPGGWVFPFGTNHLASVEVMSWGEILPNGYSYSQIASFAPRLSMIPEISSFNYGPTSSNSYEFIWYNAQAGRIDGTQFDGRIELFRNGDILTVTNGVAVYKERELPFHHDGFGQDDEWVRANFTNSAEILSVGYRDWVDSQVGDGLENGLYKLTVTIPEIPLEITQIKVGDYSVAVTNEGEYVFLLEKGVKYPLSVFPADFTNLTYSAVDDISSSRIRSGRTISRSNFVWTIGVGGFLYEPSSLGALGWCMWVPNLRGSPDVDHLGPGDFPKVFTAVITDCRYTIDALYEWSSSGVDVDIVTPYNKSTLIRVKTMPSWREANLNVVATLCGTQLISTLSGFSYGTNNIPQINLSLSIPRAILLNSNKVDVAKLARGDLSFSSDIKTNGVLKLSCISGGERVSLWDNTNKHNSVSLPYVCDVEEFDNLEFFVEGIVESDGISDVKFKAEFIPSAGRKLETEAESTVIKVGDLILPGAPSDGLLIMRGTSVAAKVECKPQEASTLLSTMWQTRRLKTDGSYTPWNYVAGNYYDNQTFIHTAEGGIYQIRVIASAESGSDERYYVWQEDEDMEIGLNKKGNLKAFGVCDEQWQIELRNCAKSYLGSPEYARSVVVPGLFGYSEFPEKTWKCNIFVAHMVSSVGLNIPHNTHWFSIYPPVANDWSGNMDITNWERITEDIYIQPGFVVGHPAFSGPGHCGILDFDGAGIAAGEFIVNRRYDEWLDGTSGFRRYKNEK